MQPKRILTLFVAISMLTNTAFAASAQSDQRIIMLDLDPATNQVTAQEFTSQAAVEALDSFERYMRGEISSQALVTSLMSEPSEYRNKVSAIGEVIKKNGLLSGDETVANKIYRLQADLNEAILKHNKEVKKKIAKYSALGAGVLVLAGLGTRSINRSDSTIYAFLFDIVLFSAGGAILGAFTANTVHGIMNEGKFEQNELLDSNK